MGPRPDDPLPVIPDDASELEPDRIRWLAEERAKRRRNRLRRLIGRPPGLGRIRPLMLVSLLATCALAALAVFLTPRIAEQQPKAVALAPTPTVDVPVIPDTLPAPDIETVALAGVDAPPPPGLFTSSPAAPARVAWPVAGRRLPDGRLVTAAGTRRIQDLRPSMIVLVPDACGCAATIQRAAAQARPFHLRIWLVSPGGTQDQRDQLKQLTDDTAGPTSWALDGSAVLLRGLRGRDLTLALIQADGVIRQVRRNVRPDRALPDLQPQLALLGLPGQ